MPAPLRIQLNLPEEETLAELRKAISVPYRTRDRAHMLKLNAQGKNVPEIARIFNCHEHTVRATIRRWELRGLVGLWEESGRGAKPKWKAEDLEYIENCLNIEQRTYNSVQLARKLKEERAVDLSGDRLRKILKKKISLEKNQTEQSEKTKSTAKRD
ncbi:MAG: helix-turn-helix domain-containing protein [Waterburya sp.]